MSLSVADLEDLADEKVAVFKRFIAAEPPETNGESLIKIWEELYDDRISSAVVQTVDGPSDDESNRVFPYEKLQAIVGDGGNWKWPRMWQLLDEVERRGAAFREGEELNFGQPNKNPNLSPQRVLIVGGGPVGLRLAIELVMGGHRVTVFEKRREARTDGGDLEALGFTNRINRPHMWAFVRNDLAKLNGKNFMSRQACYPVFTEPDTSSIGIDELQLLLLKNALLLGVDFRLGVGYTDAKVATDPKTVRPTWRVDCTYDEAAAEKFNMSPGRHSMTFDVLIGCDGPRSSVRDTQAKHFGNIEKRKFMDCVGIVANVRKVSKKRLKEMGFPYGQEPNDMNRTKMIFRDFFDKISREAEADLENIIYYKASFHNYTILTPKRADLVKHGLSGKVYHHTVAREAGGGGKDEEKAKLKTYCAKVLKAAGIPVDETLPNEGFVDAPNDVMAFDFAECWNTKKNMVFNLPPADYDVEKHGEWRGSRLVPLVGLAGDALLEPFWPMGLGLKRGWQAIMDTCYAIDNLYSRTLFCSRKGADPKRFEWDDHYEALREQIAQNFECCSRLKVGDELGKGEYADNGVVMTQLRKKDRDMTKPVYEVEIDPWTRYAPLEKETGDAWKLALKEENPKLHPKVEKELAKKEYYDKHLKPGSSTNELIYEGKKLLSVQGKVVGAPAGGNAGGEGGGYRRKSSITIPPPVDEKAVKAAMPIPKEEVERASLVKKQSLVQSVLANSIEAHVQATHLSKSTDEKSTSRRQSNLMSAIGGIRLPGLGSTGSASGAVPSPTPGPDMDEIALGKGLETTDSVAETTEAMWDRMHEKHLSPVQAAELAHIRNMVAALTKSLESYRSAEKELLLGGRK